MDVAIKVALRGMHVVLTVSVPRVQDFEFSFHAGSEWAARLLEQAVRDRLGETASAMRESSYCEGWRDAKAKRAGRKHFDSLLGLRHG